MTTRTPPGPPPTEPRTGPLVCVGIVVGQPMALAVVRVSRRPQFRSDRSVSGESYRHGLTFWRIEESKFVMQNVDVAADVVASNARQASAYYDDAPVGFLLCREVPPFESPENLMTMILDRVGPVARRVTWAAAREALTGSPDRDPAAAIAVASKVLLGYPVRGGSPRYWREVVTAHHHRHAMALGAGLAVARSVLWHERLSGLKAGVEGVGQR